MTFKALNEAWIRRDYDWEAKDEEILGDPEGRIVERGGQVLFVLVDGEVAGS